MFLQKIVCSNKFLIENYFMRSCRFNLSFTVYAPQLFDRIKKKNTIFQTKISAVQKHYNIFVGQRFHYNFSVVFVKGSLQLKHTSQPANHPTV